jgi:DNA-binding CsgD family transcriptional regulator
LLAEAQSGNAAATVPKLQALYALAKRHGLVFPQAALADLLGQALMLANQVSQAQTVGELCLALCVRPGFEGSKLAVLEWLPKAYALQHRHADAYRLSSLHRELLDRQRQTPQNMLMRCFLFEQQRHLQQAGASAEPPASAFEVNRPLAQHWRLTPTEMRLLPLLAQGKTNPQLAQDLGRSVNTVRNAVSQLLLKLEASSRTSIISKALSLGLVRQVQA